MFIGRRMNSRQQKHQACLRRLRSPTAYTMHVAAGWWGAHAGGLGAVVAAVSTAGAGSAQKAATGGNGPYANLSYPRKRVSGWGGGFPARWIPLSEAVDK